MKSLLAYIVCAITMLYAALVFYPKWQEEETESTIGWDVAGYYWYLPATFIYKDLKQQKFGDSIILKYRPSPEFQQSFVDEKSGNRVNVYSCGMSLMYLPAFTIAHIVAKPLGYPADGFSRPYQAAIAFQSLLVALLGLWLFRRLFKYYYSDGVVAILLLILAIGTNYLNYAAIETAQTHNYLFTLYAALLLCTYHYYRKPSIKYAVGIGLYIGLAVLIRPSEIIAILLPLLWGINKLSLSALKERAKFLLDHKKHFIIATTIIILIGSIQIFYWLYITGRPLVYSYRDQGFSWLSPHLYLYTLSSRSGWLTYTPMLFLSVIGIIPFIKYGKNRVGVLLFFILNLYIVSAWDIWWYGGTGGRAMIQSYPIILFPMATLLARLQYIRWLKYIFIPIIVLFAYVNIWFTYQAHTQGGLYEPTSMTNQYLRAVIGRWEVPIETEKLKDAKEIYTKSPTNLKLIYSNDFEDDSSQSPYYTISGDHSIFLDANVNYSPMLTFPFKNAENANWVRASASFYSQGNIEHESWKMTQFVVRFLNNGNIVKHDFIRVQRHIGINSVGTVYIDTRIPDQTFDSINIHFWNPGSYYPLIIDDLMVSSFKE